MSDFKLFGRRTRMLMEDHSNCNEKVYCSCPQPEAPAETAELICSDTVTGQHKPVIDLDLPVRLVPSGTPGHSHLYIDKGMDAGVFFNLLDAMADAGIVERGYANASRERGYAAVRHPDRPKLDTKRF